MDKQDKILKILQEANKQADALTATQAKQLVDLLVSLTTKQVKELVNQFNQFSDSVSQETFKQIQNALIEIREKANTNQLEVRQLSNKNKKDFETAIARANDLILELQSIEIPEPEEIDTEAIINETLSRIPKIELPKEIEGEDIVDKINSLNTEPENQIDFSHIKNAPEFKGGRGGSTARNLYQLGDVNITEPTNTQVLTYDSSNNLWKNADVTGGSGAVDSVNGQTGVVVLDTDDISDTATSRYTNDTDITRLANTSGTNTGDQDLSSYAKLTDTAQDITANSFITDGGTSSQFVKGDGSLDGSVYITGNQTITLSGDVTGSGTTGITTTIAAGAVDIAMLSASGTPSSSTYLRGDNTWATVSGGGSFGTDNQIPYTNSGGTDFDYSANLTFDGALNVGGNALPLTSNGGALGSTTKQWSDLFLANGGVANWDNGNYTLTHSQDYLGNGILSGNSYFINAKTIAASGIPAYGSGASILMSNNYTINGSATYNTNNNYALSNLFLIQGYGQNIGGYQSGAMNNTFYMNGGNYNYTSNHIWATASNDLILIGGATADRLINLKTSSQIAGGASLGIYYELYLEGVVGTQPSTHYGVYQTSGTALNYFGGASTFNKGITVEGVSSVFNEAGIDIDFRIESDIDTNAFFLDGANSEITIGGYGSGSITGTATYNLAVDSTGKIIEVATGGGSGATTALDNLASVAINTSLISDTNNTDDLGSTGIRWKKTWTVDLESTNMPTVGGTSLSSTFSPIAGSASITTVGTIGTGTWQGTAIGDTYISNTLTGKSVNGVTLVTGGTATKYLSEDGTYTTPATGLTWSVVTGTTQAAAVNKGYFTNNAAQVVVTLPATFAVGDTFKICGMGAGGWKLAQNASQLIVFTSGGVAGLNQTTTGTGGFIASSDSEDAIELVASVANTTLRVVSLKGNIVID